MKEKEIDIVDNFVRLESIRYKRDTLIRALRTLTDHIDYGVCNSISSSSKSFIIPTDFIPELLWYKPDIRHRADLWWPMHKREIRIKVLTELIYWYTYLLTEPTKSTLFIATTLQRLRTLFIYRL